MTVVLAVCDQSYDVATLTPHVSAQSLAVAVLIIIRTIKDV